jgi:hypothetical protein
MIRQFCYGLAIALFAAALTLLAYVVAYFRLAHPGLTETQLFLANWERIGAAVACTLLAYGLTSVAEGIGADS